MLAVATPIQFRRLEVSGLGVAIVDTKNWSSSHRVLLSVTRVKISWTSELVHGKTGFIIFPAKQGSVAGLQLLRGCRVFAVSQSETCSMLCNHYLLCLALSLIEGKGDQRKRSLSECSIVRRY